MEQCNDVSKNLEKQKRGNIPKQKMRKDGQNQGWN